MRPVILGVFLAAPLLVGVLSRSAESTTAFACGICDNCWAGHTNALNPNVPNESEGIHTECIAVAGCPHPDCVGGFAVSTQSPDFERVLAKAEAGDAQAAVTLIRRYSGSVVYNAERQALQFRTPCSGNDYVGHLPLTPEQNRRLARS